jgi:hypothetical protein
MEETMSIIRIEKTDDFSIISNECLRDPSMTARAKGLFAYLMTLPDDWKVRKTEIHTHFKEGRDALNTAFSELEKCGYISKTPARNEDGTVDGWTYTVCETTALLKTRQTVYPLDGEPATTKYLSELSTNNTNGVANAPAGSVLDQSEQTPVDKATTPPKRRRPPPPPPTLEEVVAWSVTWAQRHGKPIGPVKIQAKKGWEYYERGDWHDVKGNKVKSWKQKIALVWLTDEKLASAGGSGGMSIEVY